MKRLSILQKKRGDLKEAIRLWQAAAERGHLYAFIELAKHYEHKLRDIKTALQWTQVRAGLRAGNGNAHLHAKALAG